MPQASSVVTGRSEAAGVGLVHAVLQFAERTIRSWRNRKSVMQLSELDDHILADLGVTHGDVMTALSQRFSRDPSSELQRIARGNRWRAE